MPSPKLTKSSVANALAAAATSGLTVSAVILHSDGSMRIEFLNSDLINAANNNPPPHAPKKWGQKK